MIGILTLISAGLLGASVAQAQVYSSTPPDSIVSTADSTEATLGTGVVFTGLAEDVSGFSQIVCTAFSDTDSADGGFSLEFSKDGTNWDNKNPTTVSAGVVAKRSETVEARFFRVVYTNGPVVQTEFRLQCIYHKFKSVHFSTSAVEEVTDNSDVELVRQSSSYLFDVSRGIVKDHFYVNVFGFNPDVGATEEFVWETGGDYTGFLTAAVNIEIVSDSALDDDGSAGAHSVVVFGLDENFDQIRETIDLNGTTPNLATTETSWIRVQKIFVFDVGTYATTGSNGANIGMILARVAGGGATLAEILPQKGESGMAITTIPAGVRCSFMNLTAEVTAASNREATIRMWRRPRADDVIDSFASKRRVAEFEGVSGFLVDDVLFTHVFDEKTDLFWTAVLSGSGSSAGVNLNWRMHCYPSAGLPSL